MFVPGCGITDCAICHTEFSFVKRPHHRGKCIPGDCNKNKLGIKDTDRMERVCRSKLQTPEIEESLNRSMHLNSFANIPRSELFECV